jgi:pantoate--beta-alanine ligase
MPTPSTERATVGNEVALLDRPNSMRSWSAIQQRAGRRLGLVPTMGALHEGHLSLIDLARRHSDVVVVSIFVNPLQFDRRDDFDAYPRPIDDDLDVCRERGVDAVYAPTRAVMYPEGFDTTVVPGELASSMEGLTRPGHFTGVTTVVSKLFGAVCPDVAVFGEKDYQQLAIIKRMTADLDLGVEIVAASIVREADGLALSSRNRRLSEQDRRRAVVVPRSLAAAAAAYERGDRDPRSVESEAAAVVEEEPAAKLDYVTVFDGESLIPLADGVEVDDRARIATAVWFGDVRLIDNRPLSAPPPGQ